jgi:ketosteroid isomerase-like protein
MPVRFALAFLAIISLGAQTVPAVPDIGALWAADWSAKKLDHVMTLYATDAVFFATDGHRFAGAPTIRDFFKTTLATNDASIHMHRVATEQSGKLAYESGDYQETIVSGGHSTDYKGDYVLVLRKQNGHWLIAQQVFTGAPVPAR